VTHISGSANRRVATPYGEELRTILDRVATAADFAEPESKDSPLPFRDFFAPRLHSSKNHNRRRFLKRLVNRRGLLSSLLAAQRRAAVVKHFFVGIQLVQPVCTLAHLLCPLIASLFGILLPHCLQFLLNPHLYAIEKLRGANE